MYSIFIFFVASSIFLKVLISPVLAASPSPSPKSSPKTSITSPTPSPTAPSASDSANPADDTVKKNIKDRIEKVIEERKDGESRDKRLKRAIVGKVEKINTESITIKTMTGVETAKFLDGKTVILMLPKLQPVELQDIEIGGFVIAMGYINEDELLEVRRLLVSPTPLFPIPRKIFVGTLKKVTTKDITVLTRENVEKQVLLSKNTKYRGGDGEKILRTDLEPENEVFVVVEYPDQASSSANLVRMVK